MLNLLIHYIYFYLSLLETSKSFLEKESTFDTNDSGLDSSSRILFVEDVDFASPGLDPFVALLGIGLPRRLLFLAL